MFPSWGSTARMIRAVLLANAAATLPACAPPKCRRHRGDGATTPSHLLATALSPRLPRRAPLCASFAPLLSSLRGCCGFRALRRSDEHYCRSSSEDRDEEPP